MFVQYNADGSVKGTSTARQDMTQAVYEGCTQGELPDDDPQIEAFISAQAARLAVAVPAPAPQLAVDLQAILADPANVAAIKKAIGL